MSHLSPSPMQISHRFLLAIGCILASTGVSAQSTQRVMTPVEAITSAAEAATTSQRVVRGVFEIVVLASGRQDSLLYLNSELDYRDQRCLTVAITPAAQRAFAQRGVNPDSAFAGKRIRVTGAAQRITVWFYSQGKRTEKYYYQTHVPVFRPDQITIVADR